MTNRKDLLQSSAPGTAEALAELDFEALVAEGGDMKIVLERGLRGNGWKRGHVTPALKTVYGKRMEALAKDKLRTIASALKVAHVPRTSR